jgi:chemotaxis protein histidine kinase CheA
MSKLIVERLAVEFGFNVEEGMACLKTKVKVPFVKALEGQCDGLKMNGGLFTQCTNKPMATGELCKTCQKQADASGKPTCGLASEREAEGEAWRDPKGRAPVAFGKVMQKEGLNQEVVEREMTRLFGKGDYETYFVMPEKTTKKAKKEDGEKKQRGRPKKNKEVVALTEGDDLIATLIAQARTESDGAEKPVEEETKEEAVEAVAPDEKPKKVKKAKLTEEEKAAAKQAKADAKAAAKEEAKAAKLAEKEAAKASKAAEKAAAKEAAKQAKADAKAAAKEAKKAEKKTTKKTTKKTKKTEVVEEPAAPVEELTADSPVEEVKVRKVTLGDAEYLMDQENTVYDLATQEPIGVWDEETQTIVEEEME